MKLTDTSIFKAYDIRGIYPKNINEKLMEEIVRGIYTFLATTCGKRDISIAVGRDMRLSSPGLYQVAVATLIHSGAQVVEIGLAATPTIYYAVKKLKLDTGIQISASHNPKEYNGIKIVRRDADRLIKIAQNTGLQEIVKIIQAQKYLEFIQGGRSVKKNNILEDEIDTALLAIHPGDVSRLKVVIDPANAMGILPAGSLFDRLDATLIKMNFDLDGTFPAHQADPLQHKTLRDLQSAVVKHSADFGIALDGDADRAMFIDEKGGIVPATLITTLIAGEILRGSPGSRILVDIRYVRNVESMVKKLGGEVGYTKIGHSLITQQINNEEAEFAGESSGHYYFKSMGGCESTVRVILYVLSVLSREKKPFSEILSSITTAAESGEFNYILPKEMSSKTIVEKLMEKYSDGSLSRLDGIAIDYPDWRFSVRSSNTEPLIRLNVEGDSREIVEVKRNEISDFLKKFGAIHKE